MEKEPLILLVDDEPGNLKLIQMILKQDYRIAAVTSGKMALTFLERNIPDLILLDINMPEMSGWDTIEKIHAREESRKVPVIFLTGDNDAETESRCFAVGAVDFIGKPFVPQVLIERVRRIMEIENYRKNLETMVEQKVAQISEIQENVIYGIANLIESRDSSTGTHVKKTRAYVEVLTDELRKRGMYTDILTQKYAENTIKASVLHDVGKIKIPDAVLTKPGRLTDEEYTIIKQHAAFGDAIIADILKGVEDKEYIHVARALTRHHHERWDGKGYPDALAGTDIPLCARIMSIADVFDALAAERCYKKPIRPIEKVFDILQENAGTQFDPELIQIFLECAPAVKEIAEEE